MNQIPSTHPINHPTRHQRQGQLRNEKTKKLVLFRL